MRRYALFVLVAACLAASASGATASTATPLDIREGVLATALADLARQARIELLFDRALVRGLKARPVRGRLSGEAALSKLLAGSGVGYRTTPDGAFVLFAIPAPRPPAETGDGAVSELLVVGRRTQNVDIRRTESDIQPYQVFGRAALQTADRDSVDDFLRARASANTQAGPLALHGGENRSSIDLRGFGEASTLVLVDGRRMPFVPSIAGDLSQADISGVPPGAIERIEVLTTTAGGIYGPGAIGGVVNLVLRRDYRGADLTAFAGGSDRGDAGRFRLEGRLGFTPDHGATDVMLFVAHSEATPLRTGQRNYAERAGRLSFANDPDDYVASLPVRSGISVVSADGDLTLNPAHGGAALGSSFTYLPLGFAGTPADAGALLLANAKTLPPDLSDDLAGKRAYIATVPRATSGLLNIRHRIGSRVEVFFDGLYARNTGQWEGAAGGLTLWLAAGQPSNPFDQAIGLTFPAGIVGGATSYRFDTRRWTTGAIVDLAHGWKASADYTQGQSRVRRDSRSVTVALPRLVVVDGPGVAGKPDLQPFGNWAAVAAALPAYAQHQTESVRLREDLRDASLRLSGPLLTLPGGPLTATLVAEDRDDRISNSRIEIFGSAVAVPSRGQRVQSGYAELRAPLVAQEAGNRLLRGLELQLAVRHDRSTQSGPTQYLTLDEDPERFSVRRDATMFTAGARVLPTSRLMLRASVATGERPPSLADFQGAVVYPLYGPGMAPPDPRRSGRLLGSEGPWTVLVGGSPRVESAQARSFTLGAVLNPERRGGARLSVDYSRIVVSREPGLFPLTREALLAAEARYPDRVIRAPVTAADIAAGFSVGRVVSLDMTTINAGRTVVEAVDVQLDWLLATDEIGDFRPYGAITWQPTLRNRQSPGASAINSAGDFDGPLKWRGNAGVAWARGPVSADLNVQYYDSYHVRYADPSSVGNPRILDYQGAESIPAQVYVDLALRRRFTAPFGPGPLRTLEARISVQNLFDQSPPIVADSSDMGFSGYGDPRRRQITVALSAQF